MDYESKFHVSGESKSLKLKIPKLGSDKPAAKQTLKPCSGNTERVSWNNSRKESSSRSSSSRHHHSSSSRHHRREKDSSKLLSKHKSLLTSGNKSHRRTAESPKKQHSNGKDFEKISTSSAEKKSSSSRDAVKEKVPVVKVSSEHKTFSSSSSSPPKVREKKIVSSSSSGDGRQPSQSTTTTARVVSFLDDGSQQPPVVHHQTCSPSRKRHASEKVTSSKRPRSMPEIEATTSPRPSHRNSSKASNSPSSAAQFQSSVSSKKQQPIAAAVEAEAATLSNSCPQPVVHHHQTCSPSRKSHVSEKVSSSKQQRSMPEIEVPTTTTSPRPPSHRTSSSSSPPSAQIKSSSSCKKKQKQQQKPIEEAAAKLPSSCPPPQSMDVQTCSPSRPSPENEATTTNPSLQPQLDSSSPLSFQMDPSFSQQEQPVVEAQVPSSSPLQQQQQQTVFLVPNLPLPPPPPQQVYVEIPRTLESSSSSSSNSSALTKVDIFPLLTWNDVPRFDLDIPNSPSSIRSFINILKGHRVYFHVVDSKQWTANIERHYAQAQQCKPIVYDKLDWAKVERRLSLRPTSERHNEDLRLVHRWDNTYLVKAYFTFGQRTPEAGTSHIIQTSAAPVLFYELDGSKKFSQQRDDIRRRKKKFSRTVADEHSSSSTTYGKSDVSPKCFSSYDQYLYERYVLQPFSIYRIAAGTSYVMLSYQKTLFRIDVVPDAVVEDMEYRGVYRFASPTSDRVARPNASKGYTVSYNHPPPTPIALPPSSSSSTTDVYIQQQQQPQQLEELYSVAEEQQLLQQLLGSYEEMSLPQQQQQPVDGLMDSLPNSEASSGGTGLDEQLTQSYAAAAAATTTGQQITLYIQPQQTTPQKPETRDAAVNTDSSLGQQCINCSSYSSVSVETVSVSRKATNTRGLGIAKKRISSCTKEQPEEPKKKRRMEDNPIDLSCCVDSRRDSSSRILGVCNLPPAPQKTFEDSGVFQSFVDEAVESGCSDGESCSSDDEEESCSGTGSDGEEGEEEEQRSCCDSDGEQDLQMDEEEMSFDVPQVDDDQTEEDAAVASITSMPQGEELWENFV